MPELAFIHIFFSSNVIFFSAVTVGSQTSRTTLAGKHGMEKVAFIKARIKLRTRQKKKSTTQKVRVWVNEPRSLYDYAARCFVSLLRRSTSTKRGTFFDLHSVPSVFFSLHQVPLLSFRSLTGFVTCQVGRSLALASLSR